MDARWPTPLQTLQTAGLGGVRWSGDAEVPGLGRMGLGSDRGPSADAIGGFTGGGDGKEM